MYRLDCMTVVENVKLNLTILEKHIHQEGVTDDVINQIQALTNHVELLTNALKCAKKEKSKNV